MKAEKNIELTAAIMSSSVPFSCKMLASMIITSWTKSLNKTTSISKDISNIGLSHDAGNQCQHDELLNVFCDKTDIVKCLGTRDLTLKNY